MFKKRKNNATLANPRVHKEDHAWNTEEGKVEEEDEESLSSLETLQRLKQEQASRRKTNGIAISLDADYSQKEIHSRGSKGRNIDAKDNKFERKQLEPHSSQLTHEALKEAYVAEKLGLLPKTADEYCLLLKPLKSSYFVLFIDRNKVLSPEDALYLLPDELKVQGFAYFTTYLCQV